MRDEYLVFNINNCAEDYVSVYEFCEKLVASGRKVELPINLLGKVYWYQRTESCRTARLFSMIALEMKKGTLKKYDAEFIGEKGELRGCIRIAHEAGDATIEYIYLDALLHKFPGLVCLLYIEGNDEEKYAVRNKAVSFFYGFPVGEKIYKERIYCETYGYLDHIWHIEKLDAIKAEAVHSKVNPVIELNDKEQEVMFWRNSRKQHEQAGNKDDNRLQQIYMRCRMNFIEEYNGKSKKRNKYYQGIFDSVEFMRETEDMPLLAFYLFCMQMFYMKNGQRLSENEMKRIRLNAWDIADGILQLMENIHHTTEKVGFLDIRVHENYSAKGYLNKRYGINDKNYKFYYEMRLLDISRANIVESFQRQMENQEDVKELRVADFFEARHEDKVDNFWRKYNQKEENLVHHYGLQVFSSIISANDGVFKVVSSSKFQYDRTSETYVNKDGWNKGDSGVAHLPGTEYIILLPLRGREQHIVTAVEADMEYEYDMETDYIVQEYNQKQTDECISRRKYENQEQKECLINELAEKMFHWMKDKDEQLKEEQEFVTLIAVRNWVNFPLEIYCKALILCGIWWQSRCKKKLYCIINECAENQILEIARLFAIFYCKAYLPRYLTNMQIYLAGESEEFLITGSNLDSLYAITSKIMLVKGINKETAGIMKYLLDQYRVSTSQAEYSEKMKLVPFDTLELPDNNVTLFEMNVMRTLNADIQKHSLGCKISNTHMRIGSKLHINSFFEAELLFHNDYYISRFADLILKMLPIEKDKKLILVGYETYSELLLYKIVTKLRGRGVYQALPYQASYMIYEQRIGGKFRYMDESCLISNIPLQFAIIIPINSTLTTHNKVRDALEEELQERGVQIEENLPIIANYALIQVRSSTGDQCDEQELKFWDSIRGKVIKTSLIPQGEPDVEYFVCVNTKWYPPLQCPYCFPERFTEEKPLIETDRTSIVPIQMLGMTEPDLIPRAQREKNEENLKRVNALKDCLVYKHVIRNGNHYLYYFCLERYFIQERENIIQWLKEERNKRTETVDGIVYDIIVSPLHYSNAGFLAEVNHYLFDNAALVLNFEVEKEFRENVKTKYSNIIGLYYNLVQMRKKALIRFHFVDDTIVSGRTFARAKTIFQSLITPVNEDIQIEVFSDIVIMLNRMSYDSITNLISNNVTAGVDWARHNHFHAYVNLNISSMRNHEDACTECKLVTNFTNLRNQSSTNQQYKFWNAKILRHQPKEIQNKMQEELIAKESEQRERAYRRMLCTHLANEKLGELGYEKNSAEKTRKVMIELLTEQKEEQMEWIISYIKIFSRPFVSFLKSNREAIFQIMLWMIEYITKDLVKNHEGIGRRYNEIREICICIQKQHKVSDQPICKLLIILMKRLSDLGSNYVIRKENILGILDTISKLKISEEEKEDFRKRYIGIIKRICCQSSDESKSIYLEYLILCGEEYGTQQKGKEKDVLESDRPVFFSEVKAENFAEVAFLENTRVLNDGIHDLTRDVQKNQKKDSQNQKSVVELLKEYYYENFTRLLYLYGYWNASEERLTEEGERVLRNLVELYQYLNGDNEGGKEKSNEEKDAELYYKHLLEIMEHLTGVQKCYLLYGTALRETEEETGTGQYYRIQANQNVEYLKITDVSLGTKKLVAETYVPAFLVEEDDIKLKRTVIKYDIYNGEEITLLNTIYLQLDFPEQFTERKIFILLKMVMIFHNMILQHLKQDFSNNMIQKWSAREYFNKQVLLQRATDHTDRDNLLKYYNEISGLYRYEDTLDEAQKERDKALFHMVINSYIARMNVQILAEANPEREPSKAAFAKVYQQQLEPLIKSMHVIERFRILDENGEEKFSEDLLERKVRLRQTEDGESLSLRRISIIITELILSAINHSGTNGIADVYIYRENEYLVVKNRFYSKKGKNQINRDIQDSVERKKDGISLATIKGTVNACYKLLEHEGVVINAEQEDGGKYFYVKLPILHIWEE